MVNYSSLLFAGYILSTTVADLPVHCELGSIVGEWRFWVSKVNDPALVPPLPMKMDGTRFCSGLSGRPTENSFLMSNYAHRPEPSEHFSESFEVGLAQTQRVHRRGGDGEFDRHDLLAIDGDTKGRWTMIFDEGFEVRLGDRSFLAISRYTCEPGNPEAWCRTEQDAHEDSTGKTPGWVTNCGETFMGWYHQTDPKSGQVTGLGCWFGRRNPGPAPKYLLEPLSTSFAQSKSFLGPDRVPNACDIDDGIEDMQTKSLPTSFSWRDQFSNIAWQSPITVQGDCGSCYAVAAVYALQSRANLLLAREGINEPLRLSTQSVVSCSYYNQGCNGGLEMLVHRHAKEAGIPPESCMAYTSGRNGNVPTCDSACFSDTSELVYAKDYGYVGGFNGQCSEARLLRNLYEYGPLTVAVNVENARVGSLAGMPGTQAPGRGDTDTIAVRLEGSDMGGVTEALYRSSKLFPYLSSNDPEVASATVGFVFLRASKIKRGLDEAITALQAALAEQNRIDVKLTDAFTVGIHGWEYIDHSIVLLGYGEENGKKFWSIRNSWGGENEYGAYTDLSRGHDIGAVESGAVWVQPDPCRGKLAKILKKHDKYDKYCTDS